MIPSGVARRLRLLLLDVDGVLTDGGLYMGPNDAEYKRFDVRDGYGLHRLQGEGIEVGLVSGRWSEAVERRAAELSIDLVRLGCGDKLAELNDILKAHGLQADEVAFMGDDLMDLPTMEAVGLAVAPADALDAVRRAAHYVCQARGGHGAVREVVDAILASREAEGAGRCGFKVVIPARYGSTRLPGKALADLGGLPMVERVRRLAMASQAEEVWVATDDGRIADAVRAHGGNVCRTLGDHASGTERVEEVCRRLGWGGDDIVVNLQGDEPLLPPAALQTVAQLLADHPRAEIATLAAPMEAAAEARAPDVVKVVVNAAGEALYFSRLAVPYVRGGAESGPFLRHVGIYAYRLSYLKRHVAAPPPAMEIQEGLEQLRALWLGATVQVGLVSDPPPPGVDTPEDLRRVQRLFEHGPAR